MRKIRCPKCGRYVYTDKSGLLLDDMGIGILSSHSITCRGGC